MTAADEGTVPGRGAIARPRRVPWPKPGRSRPARVRGLLRPDRAHAHGMLRPAFRLLPMLALGDLGCYAGLLLDDRALMAAVCAVCTALAVDLALAAIGSSIPARPLRRTAGRGDAGRGRAGRAIMRAAARPAGFAAATLLAAAVIAVLRLHELTGRWPFDWPSGCAGTESADCMPFNAWTALGEQLESGFLRLNRQLPPLAVADDSDLFLVAVVAVAAILIRCLLAARAAAPWMAVLPVAALAADSAFLGHTAP